jgi:hypothetical protein
MRTQLVAATVALGLLGGATAVAAPEQPSARLAAAQSATSPRTGAESVGSPSAVDVARAAPRPSASSLTGVAARRNRVALRTIESCVYRGRVTTCVISVNRLAQRGQRVVAFGTIRPKDGPAIEFRRRVVGVANDGGVFGESGLMRAQPAPSCGILSLVLGPLHLDVLGLVVDLNRVVLDIVGQTGAGNLLGNLLCALTGILDGSVILTRFLAVLTELLEAINAVLAL